MVIDACWERRLAHIVWSNRTATVALIAENVHYNSNRTVSEHQTIPVWTHRWSIYFIHLPHLHPFYLHLLLYIFCNVWFYTLYFLGIDNMLKAHNTYTGIVLWWSSKPLGCFPWPLLEGGGRSEGSPISTLGETHCSDPPYSHSEAGHSLWVDS